jgi:hypothetical protein
MLRISYEEVSVRRYFRMRVSQRPDRNAFNPVRGGKPAK